VGGIAGAEYKAAFAIFCMLIVALVVIELIIFKKKKWM
jgi:Mg2+ and Co2+ transporter CorA